MASNPDDVIKLAEQYRNELIANDARALGRLARAYHRSFQNLSDKVELLARDIEGGKYTATQVHRMERYKSLMAQIADELRDLQGLTRVEMEALAKFGIEKGGQHAAGLIAATAGDTRLAVAFNKLNPEVVKTLMGFLSPDGPLYKRMGMLASAGAERVAEDLTNGIIAGYNPVKIAEGFRKGWGMALTDAMRICRTAQLYSYREATRANYIANSDVVEGWIWHAELDPSTCAECIAMDGTRHTNDETLNDHHNGRCAMIPIVKGFPLVIDEGRGEAWFNSQSEQTQREMLGNGKYEAWRDGRFTLNDLPGTRTDDVYGEMRVEKTLKELIGE